MKKMISMVLALLLTTVLFGSSLAAAGLVFTDDFSSGNFSKWTNRAIELGDQADTECAGKSTISGGSLNINNVDPVGSFYYLSPKNITTKNFTVSMKVKA